MTLELQDYPMFYVQAVAGEIRLKRNYLGHEVRTVVYFKKDDHGTLFVETLDLLSDPTGKKALIEFINEYGLWSMPKDIHRNLNTIYRFLRDKYNVKGLPYNEASEQRADERHRTALSKRNDRKGKFTQKELNLFWKGVDKLSTPL